MGSDSGYVRGPFFKEIKGILKEDKYGKKNGEGKDKDEEEANNLFIILDGIY